MTANRSPSFRPNVVCWIPPIGRMVPARWKVPVQRFIFWMVDRLLPRATTRFYTVQNQTDADRLRTKGTPWPTGELKAHFGPGVYAWIVRQDAEEYLAFRKRNVPENLQIIAFRVWNSCLRRFQQLNLDDLEEPGDWLSQHSLLWGGKGQPHTYHYLKRGVGFRQNDPPAVEHYFHRSVFQHLWFC